MIKNTPKEDTMTRTNLTENERAELRMPLRYKVYASQHDLPLIVAYARLRKIEQAR
jgi:hypothetical protein